MSSADLCGSIGPRVGNEGTPVCRLAAGHMGVHRPGTDDGWEADMQWSRILDDPGFLFEQSPDGWLDGPWVPLGVPAEPAQPLPQGSVTGVVMTPEYLLYESDPDLGRQVDAVHEAQCGCENWVYCCPLRPALFEETVRQLRPNEEGQ